MCGNCRTNRFNARLAVLDMIDHDDDSTSAPGHRHWIPNFSPFVSALQEVSMPVRDSLVPCY